MRALVQADGRLELERGLAALRLRPGAEEPLAALVRLFLAGEAVPVAAAARAVAPARLDELERAGLVRRRDETVQALVRLDPFRDLVVPSDPRPAGERLARDHVVRPGPASETLAALTVRRRVDAALDLGTGSGVQALLAARHARRVLGTDVNARALRLAALGAALNGVDNVDWREGDLFGPAGEQRFDLIVSNPPFVLSPSGELTFRDGGRRGDELSRDVVVGAGSRLREGGFAHVLCGWALAAGEHWTEPPRRWLAGLGCDAVLLRIDTEDPVTYAVRWSALDEPAAREGAARAAEWLPYYQELGIEQIATGMIVLRRRSGATWTHVDELVALDGDAGAQLERIVAGNDALAALPDTDALAARPLTLADGVSLVQRVASDGAVERARLSVTEGMPLPSRVPAEVVPALLLLDGRRTLAEAATAASCAPDVALPVVRDLVRRGYLTVGGGR